MTAVPATTERPIIFSGPMVRAILDGRKRQTRRIIKPMPSQVWLTDEVLNSVSKWESSRDCWWRMAVAGYGRIVHCGVEMDGGHIGSIRCPYGKPGDRLWVREKWARSEETSLSLIFAADDPDPSDCENGRWRPSIHMPRCASRITLEITAVRVERLQDISEEDAIAEGCQPEPDWTAAMRFAQLWDSINSERAPWASNPFVWAISFRRCE